MCRRIALGVMILLACVPSLMAGERWTCLRSDNFELFTSDSESNGREALIFFEQVRHAFTDTLGLKLPEHKMVTIVAFADEHAFAPYRPQENVAAYSVFMPGRDLIVMQDLVPQHYQVALHEYTHVVVSQAGMKLPLWLDEGFAEFFATLTPQGDKIRVGRIIPARLRDARSGSIPLHELLAADRRSHLYHETDRSGIFYGESWALVHMLKFSDKYSPRFEQFLEAIGRGEPGEQALESVYGKSLGQIQTDLELYIRGDRFHEGIIKGTLAKSGPAPQLVQTDPLDIAVFLAAIEARGLRRQDGIRKLERLANENPGKPAPANALAWLMLGGQDRLLAIAAFHRAMDAGTRDVNLCYEYAIKMHEWIPDADYLAALRRAAEIDSGFSPAQQQLAAHAFNAHDYPEAVTRLHLVKKLDRAHACVYYRALSYAAFQIGDLAEAKSAAARAQQYAVAPEDKRLADEMLKYVSGASHATDAPRLGENPLR